MKRDVSGHRTRSIWRFCASLALMSAGLGAILARLLFVQGINAATYQADARSEYVHEFSFLGERGAILDRNGNELAMSVPMTTVFGDPYQVTNPGQEARALSVALGLPEPTLQADLSEPSGFVYLARTVPDATAAKVEKLVNDGVVPGVYTMQEPKRFDPSGQLAAPLIGMVGTDGTGLSGLEYQYNRLLEGRPGKLVEDMDPAGGQIPGGLQEYQAPVRGDDLVLSIDEPLQYDAEQALARAIVAAQANSGIALIMNSRTGELLAVAQLTMPNRSEPTTMSEPPALPVWFVPPGAVSGHGTSVASDQPVEAPSASAFTTVYEPGSVEKLVTVSAALATKAVQPNDYFSVPDPVLCRRHPVQRRLGAPDALLEHPQHNCPFIRYRHHRNSPAHGHARIGQVHPRLWHRAADRHRFPGRVRGHRARSIAVVGHLDRHRADRPRHSGYRSANARRVQHDRKWRCLRGTPSRRRLCRRERDRAPVPRSAISQGGQHDGREGDDLDARGSGPGRDRNGGKPRALYRRGQDRDRVVAFAGRRLQQRRFRIEFCRLRPR